MIDLSSLVHIIIYLLIVGGICGLLWWLVSFAGSKGLPAIFVTIGQVLVAVFGVFALINLLLSLGGGTPLVRWH
jgi:hypothetical protein